MYLLPELISLVWPCSIHLFLDNDSNRKRLAEDENTHCICTCLIRVRKAIVRTTWMSNRLWLHCICADQNFGCSAIGLAVECLFRQLSRQIAKGLILQQANATYRILLSFCSAVFYTFSMMNCSFPFATLARASLHSVLDIPVTSCTLDVLHRLLAKTAGHSIFKSNRRTLRNVWSALFLYTRFGKASARMSTTLMDQTFLFSFYRVSKFPRKTLSPLSIFSHVSHAASVVMRVDETGRSLISTEL